jgi:hypothetical protein
MIGAVSVYVGGTTRETLEELASGYDFSAHVLDESESELDVVFEHERVEDFASYDFSMVEDAVALLDELASSGCRLRFVEICYSTNGRESFEKMKNEVSYLEKHPTIETIEFNGRW